MTNNPIFCAIDTSDIDKAVALVDQISPHIGGIKLGLEFFTSCGLFGLEKMKKYELPIFVDLKLYDIPNTAKKALHNIVLQTLLNHRLLIVLIIALFLRCQ